MKQKHPRKTKKIIAKSLDNSAQNISAKAIIKEERKIETEEQIIKKFNTLIYVFGIMGLLIAIFQAVKIFALQTLTEISSAHLLSYLIVAVGWFAYGYAYKNKAIMTIYGLWIIIEIAILNGIYFYS